MFTGLMEDRVDIPIQIHAMNNMNLSLFSFAWAVNFFSSEQGMKDIITRDYISLYGRPRFIYDCVSGKKLDEYKYISCNFSYWVSCVFITYMHDEYVTNNPHLYKIVKRVGAIINNIITRYADADCDDSGLPYLLRRIIPLMERVKNRLGPIGLDVNIPPDMDRIVDIWSFATHPDVLESLRNEW